MEPTDKDSRALDDDATRAYDPLLPEHKQPAPSPWRPSDRTSSEGARYDRPDPDRSEGGIRPDPWRATTAPAARPAAPRGGDGPTGRTRSGDAAARSGGGHPVPSGRAAGAGGAPVTVRRVRKGRLAIRKINPATVFKFSLVFYFCMLLILLLGASIIFGALRAFGVIDNFESLLSELEFNVSVSGWAMFRWLFLLGLGGTVVVSAVTTFMAFLYNLIADVVGGIELMVTEREQ